MSHMLGGTYISTMSPETHVFCTNKLGLHRINQVTNTTYWFNKSNCPSPNTTDSMDDVPDSVGPANASNVSNDDMIWFV